MTYCLGIKTESGLVLASDSRTNAGVDQVNTCCKMHTLATPGERIFVLLTSGSLSVTQSVITLLEEKYARGEGLANAPNFYAAARCVGDAVRAVADLDRPALDRDGLGFNIHFLVAGQIRGEEHQLYLIYPQGNPLRSTSESPFLQIGESKYGRPILDRGIRYSETSLEEAVKYALLSLDSTMRSNVTVGPPIDLLVYPKDSLAIRSRTRLNATDPQLSELRTLWESELRRVIHSLPSIKFP